MFGRHKPRAIDRNRFVWFSDEWVLQRRDALRAVPTALRTPEEQADLAELARLIRARGLA